MRESLELLRSAVHDAWESLAQVLADHGGGELGDGAEGTALWHLRHICQVLGLHVRVATGGEVDPPQDVPDSPDPIADETRRRLTDFIAWAETQPPERWAANFNYGRPLNLNQMIGVMLRHIVWHSAAVHYWCRWRMDESPRVARVPPKPDD